MWLNQGISFLRLNFRCNVSIAVGLVPFFSVPFHALQKPVGLLSILGLLVTLWINCVGPFAPSAALGHRFGSNLVASYKGS